MSNQIQVPNRQQLDAKGQAIYDQINQKFGKVPNLYATIAYSSATLENYLGFSGKAGTSSFNNKELEAIKLAVSEINGCQYCLAAHTALAKMEGFSDEDTIALRAGSIEDKRLRTISQLAANIAQNRGKASEAAKADFFAQGFDEKALIDLIAAVTDITFTNYVHSSTKVPVDFPAARPLQNQAA